MRELHAQDRRLQLVQARVVAEQLVGDLVARAVEAQHACLVGELCVVGDDHAPVAEAAKVLRGKERERGGLAERAGAKRACGLWACVSEWLRVKVEPADLRGVLEHGHAERFDLGDGRDVAEQVHGDHGLRARSERLGDGFGVDAERLRVHVAEHGRGARSGGSPRRRRRT